jgi:hypothetical protein
LERPGALDRRFIDPRAGEHFVLPFLRGEVALGRPRLVGRQVGMRLDDVVFDQGVAGPAVDAEVAGPRGVVTSGVLDGPVDNRRVVSILGSMG